MQLAVTALKTSKNSRKLAKILRKWSNMWSKAKNGLAHPLKKGRTSPFLISQKREISRGFTRKQKKTGCSIESPILAWRDETQTVSLCVTCGLSPRTSLKKSPPSPLYKRTGKCSPHHVVRPNTRFLRVRVAFFMKLSKTIWMKKSHSFVRFLCLYRLNSKAHVNWGKRFLRGKAFDYRWRVCDFRRLYSMVRWTFIASKCPHGASPHADEEVSDVLQSSAGNRNFGGCGELETFCRSI